MIRAGIVNFRALAPALVGGSAIGFAWTIPGTVTASVLEWFALFCLIACAGRSGGSYRPAYLYGVLGHGISIFWLPEVISKFAETSLIFSGVVVAVYVLFSALQVPLFYLFFRRLPAVFRTFACTGAVAWIMTEVLWMGIKWFPWQFGHLQISFLPFIQIVEFGGVWTLSFVMLWICEAVWQFLIERRRLWVLVLPAGVVIGSSIWGVYRIEWVSEASSDTLKVALVQMDTLNQVAATEEYIRLSDDIKEEVDLVIWPQGVVPQGFHESVGDRRNDASLPRISKPAALLFSAPTHRPPVKHFNSALLLMPGGEVPIPYHKRVLVPFGEYIPYIEEFPWLAWLHPAAAHGPSPGTSAVIFEVPRDDNRSPAGVSPLICYEDLFSSLSREAAGRGAQVLVDLASGSWALSDMPLMQHHLIASFRSLETRKVLLRSSAVGLTAVVDATGRTISQLPPHARDVLVADITLHDQRTLYSSLGNVPWIFMAVLGLVGVVLRQFGFLG